jgi:RNA polymerase sigma-70 factor (ECF subfamily)
MAQAMDDLLSRARAGDMEAFTELVKVHGPDVVRLCTIVTADPIIAQDASQNTWRKVWLHLGALRDPERFRPWLYRVAANEAKQLLRRNRRHASERLDAVQGPAEPVDLTQRMALESALQTLSAEDRELLAWRYVLGMSAPEIAAGIGLTPEGVRSRLMRIRDHLREELSDE